MRNWLLVSVVAIVAAATAVPAAAQDPQNPPPPIGRPGGPGAQGRGAQPPPPAITNQQLRDIQYLIDSFQTSRVQKALGLSDARMAALVPKLRRLQDLRRLHQDKRQPRIQQLRRYANQDVPAADDVLDAAVKELSAMELQFAQDEQRALLDLDSLLTPIERVRFRLLEEQLERQKLAMIVAAMKG